MPDPLFWRLIYADDHVEDEPLANASIRLSHKGAVMLQACVYEPDAHGNDMRRAVYQVRLIDAENARLYTPVWYRKRSMTALGAGGGTIALEATILGRARDGGNDIEGTLFISYDGQTFEDCPAWAFDRVAIDGILLGA